MTPGAGTFLGRNYTTSRNTTTAHAIIPAIRTNLGRAGLTAPARQRGRPPMGISERVCRKPAAAGSHSHGNSSSRGSIGSSPIAHAILTPVWKHSRRHLDTDGPGRTIDPRPHLLFRNHKTHLGGGHPRSLAPCKRA